MTNNVDILIKNARVIDGTANPYCKADIGISQGEITRIARNINEEPDLPPLGISHVLVNGQVAVENGKIMGATSGKVLRHEAEQ